MKIFYNPFVLLISLSLSVLSCGSGNDKQVLSVFELQQKAELTTSGLIPNSYLINSSIEQSGDTLFYWDKSKSQLILIDKKYNWIANLVDGKGEGPSELTFHAGHGVANGLYFIFGYKGIAYDGNTLEYLGKYDLPKGDIEWIAYFNNRYVMGGLFYEENRYVVYSADFSKEGGFENIKEEVEIPFPSKLDELSKVAEARIMSDHLYVFKTHLAELVKIDKDFGIVFDKALPYNIGREKNITTFEDGQQDINTLEAWDFTTHNNKLYVLRHVDLVNEQMSADDVQRKTLHIMDNNGEMLGYTHLKERAFYISFIDNTLYTIDHKEEKYIAYEILN